MIKNYIVFKDILNKTLNKYSTVCKPQRILGENLDVLLDLDLIPCAEVVVSERFRRFVQTEQLEALLEVWDRVHVLQQDPHELHNKLKINI